MQVECSYNRDLTVRKVAEAVADDMCTCIGSDAPPRGTLAAAVQELIAGDGESAFFLVKKHTVAEESGWSDDAVASGSFITAHARCEYLVVEPSFLSTIADERGLYSVLKGYALHGSLYLSIFGPVAWPTQAEDTDSEMYRAACYLLGGSDGVALLMRRLHDNDGFMDTGRYDPDGELLALGVARVVMLTGMDYGDAYDMLGILDVPIEIVRESSALPADGVPDESAAVPGEAAEPSAPEGAPMASELLLDDDEAASAEVEAALHALDEPAVSAAEAAVDPADDAVNPAEGAGEEPVPSGEAAAAPEPEAASAEVEAALHALDEPAVSAAEAAVDPADGAVNPAEGGGEEPVPSGEAAAAPEPEAASAEVEAALHALDEPAVPVAEAAVDPADGAVNPAEGAGEEPVPSVEAAAAPEPEVASAEVEAALHALDEPAVSADAMLRALEEPAPAPEEGMSAEDYLIAGFAPAEPELRDDEATPSVPDDLLPDETPPSGGYESIEPFTESAVFERGVFIGDPIHILDKNDYYWWYKELDAPSGYVYKDDALLMIVHPVPSLDTLRCVKHGLNFPVESGYIAAVSLDRAAAGSDRQSISERGALINVPCAVDMMRDEHGAYSFKLHRQKRRNLRVTIDVNLE